MIKPKLALIPSGYKAEKVYSILPNNGDGDFDFDRANGYASRVRKDGLIEEVSNDVPRLDWSDGNCPSLLLEPERTNLVTYSEDFSQWTPTSVTVTNNQVLAPDGTLTADKLDFSASTSSRLAEIISTSSGTYTFSVYLKSVSGSGDFRIALVKQGGSTSVKTVSLTEEWQRFELEYTYDGLTNLIAYAGYYIDDTFLQEVYAWGGQVEEGYSTSYIKTEGGTVTRFKDECINGGDADLFNVSQLSWFVDVTNFATPLNDFCYITITDGQSTPINMIRLTFEENRIVVTVYDNGTNELGYNITSVTANQRNKVLLTFDGNEAKIYFNGVLKNTSTNVAIPTGLDSLSFTNRTENGRNFEGKVHDIRVYDKVLTEAEAIELTT